MRYLDKYPNCVGCPVKKWCGTMISCIRLCKSYQENKTEMNYEERYKQAIEAAKRELNCCGSLDCDAARQIFRLFPELRESEDERIRKALIQHIKDKVSVISGWRKEELIAWLEKQKCNTTIKFSKEDEKTRLWINHVLCECGYKFNDNGEREDAFELLEKIKQIICGSSLEKQGEQKLIEQDTEIHDLWVYIREWNEKFGRLPKDEDELAACIDYVMKRQKLSWSEEDRKHIDNIISLLNQVKEEYVRKSGQFPSWITEILWLESIKHEQNQYDKGYNDDYSAVKYNHWKPSEEQMEALKKRTHGLHASSETRKALESLINDLLKL